MPVTDPDEKLVASQYNTLAGLTKREYMAALIMAQLTYDSSDLFRSYEHAADCAVGAADALIEKLNEVK